MIFPEYAEINGKKYKINTGYKVALKCLDVINDSDITDLERALAVVFLLFGFIPENDEDIAFLLEKAKIYLECGES